MTDYTTVCNILKQKGIDLDHNRFLILQGEVEQISLMKPKAANPNDVGLLEYLEDIIGSNKYVEDIEILSKVCEECNERRIEQTNRVKASQHELRGLEREKHIAVEWIRMERRHMKLLTYKFFIDLGDAVQAYNDTMQLITQGRNEIKAKRDQKKELFHDHQSLVNEIQNLHHQQEEADRREKDLKTDFALLERQDIMINNEKKAKLVEISKTEKQIKEYDDEK